MKSARKNTAALQAAALVELNKKNIEINQETFVKYLLEADDSTALLMIQAGLDPNAWHGESNIFFAAATEGNYAVVKALIEAGANVNVCDIKGTTPLMVACSAGWYSSVKSILNVQGVAINATDKNGLSALNWAEKSQKEWRKHKMNTRGHTAVIKLLKKAGAE